MALTKIVKKLTENHREFLLSQTPRSTPDNPTESGWSASKIRQYQWQGFSTLFTLLDSVETRVTEYLNNTVTTAVDGNSGDIAILTTNISNEVLRATNAEQNLAISITNTLTSANGYTDTKFGTLNEKISNILSGELIAKKAETDSYGRKIQADRYYANLSVSVDATTGVMQFKFYNAFGEVVNTIIADTNLERIASIFDYDETTKMLYVIDYKGDRHEIDLSSLIDTYIADNQGHDCIVTIENYKVSADLPTETKTNIAKGVTAYNKATDLEASVADLDTAKADKSDVYTKEETEARLAGKQDTLVSGENIKTINGTSLLGSGNYAFDTAFDETSTNAVQNKVVSKEVKELNYELAVLREAVFEVVLSEIDYTSVFTDSFAIPDTLTDTDGTHRVVFSETQLDEVQGNSIAVNQLVRNGNFVDKSYWENYAGQGFVVNNNIATWTSGGGWPTGNGRFRQRINTTKGHKFCISYEFSSSILGTFAFESSRNYYKIRTDIEEINTFKKVTNIFTLNGEEQAAPSIQFFIISPTENYSISLKNVALIDLTQMFGIGNEPTSVDDVRIQWLIKYLESNPDYDTGTIKSSIINGLQSLDSNNEVIGTITIPPTEIKSAGTAQDYIEVVDGDIVEGEQLYNLVKKTNIGSVDLGTLNWKKSQNSNAFYSSAIPSYNGGTNRVIMAKYTLQYPYISWENMLDKTYEVSDVGSVTIKDSLYSSEDATVFKQAMSGVMLDYQSATPTQTTIATNLHFSEISMLIQEGGTIKPLYDNVPVDTTLTFVVKKAISE